MKQGNSLNGELKKQFHMHLPLSEYKLLERAAAERGIPMTVMVRQWLIAYLDMLKQPSEEKEDE